MNFVNYCLSKGIKLFVMKRMRKFGVLMVFLMIMGLSLNPFEAKGQIIEVGVSGGLSYYIGDINPNKHFSDSQFAWGVLTRYYSSSRWAFRLSYSNISLASSDAVIQYRPERGLDFKAKIHDISLVAEFNFFDYWTGSRRSYVSPYIFGGFSTFFFNNTPANGTDLHSMGLWTEGVEYSNVSFAIPFGIGVKYSIGKRIGLALEWRINKKFTDYIDDVHGLYPEADVVVDGYNYSDPTDNYLSGMQRGNSFDNDWFSYLNASVVYKFNLPKNRNCNVGVDSKYFRYY